MSESAGMYIAQSTQAVQKQVLPDEKETYHRLTQIGGGSYGRVYKAQHKLTGQIVAIKNVVIYSQNRYSVNQVARELSILPYVRHENVMRLLNICKGEQYLQHRTISLVCEFVEHDLAALMINRINLSLRGKKNVMMQLLGGLCFIHSKNIIHRDLKPANILVTQTGIVKIADFGLARHCKTSARQMEDEPNSYTPNVVTIHYRPPEILLGDTNYGKAVDMWSMGCIFGALLGNSQGSILPGRNEQHQLELISNMCGSITPEVWPDVVRLRLYNQLNLPQTDPRKIPSYMDVFKDSKALDLFDKLMVLDPKRRLTVSEARCHEFFTSDPVAVDLKPSSSKLKTCQYVSPEVDGLAVRQPNSRPSISINDLIRARGHIVEEVVIHRVDPDDDEDLY